MCKITKIMEFLYIVFGIILVAVKTVPAADPVVIKQSPGLRNQHMDDGEGDLHKMDGWMKLSDITGADRFNPDTQNVLHLFTRANPSTSQPIVLNNDQSLTNSNFDPARRTVIIIHGWTQSATSDINTVLTPAFLQAADLNVFVLDWSAGASILAGGNAPDNAVASGVSLARAIDWICARTGVDPASFHLVAFSLGAHLAGVAGRNVRSGRIAYITVLDPGADMEDSGHIFGPDAATYTEAIHTNAQTMGHGPPLAHVDFYPNGGARNPGCGFNFLCNHKRSFFFFAETLTTSTGFTGKRCGSYSEARVGNCTLPGSLRMGGLNPKFGNTGIFHLRTNAAPPFSTD